MAGRKQVSNGAVAVAVVALLVVATAARAGAAMVCNTDPSALETYCRPYCGVGSKESKPNPQCCAAVKDADFKCLCGYKGMLRAYRLDPNRAMQIPSKCEIDGATANPCG